MTLSIALLAVAAAAEPIALTTSDGATVSLHHFSGDGRPVLLVHGLSSNHRSFDLDDRGLAHDLQDAGYDVWMLDLRGRLDSTPPPGRPAWSLDDYGRHDLPAAIDHIRAESGHDTVAYVGHSMGGMVLAIYHHWHGGSALGPAVVLGSPLTFDHPDPLVRASGRSMRTGQLLRKVPSPAAAKSAAVLPRTARVDALLFDDQGTSAATRKAMYRAIVSPMTAGELKHLGHIVRAGQLVSADGTIDYVDSLADWTTPLLVVAGRTDRVAPPDRVVSWIDAIPSANTTFLVAGTARGYPHEYGHLDLILADNASAHLHADILGWLQQH